MGEYLIQDTQLIVVLFVFLVSSFPKGLFSFQNPSLTRITLSSTSRALIATNAVFMVVAVIVISVIVGIYIRKHTLQTLKAGDYLIAVALVRNLGENLRRYLVDRTNRCLLLRWQLLI